jgi:hypothetical protein
MKIIIPFMIGCAVFSLICAFKMAFMLTEYRVPATFWNVCTYLGLILGAGLLPAVGCVLGLRDTDG